MNLTKILYNIENLQIRGNVDVEVNEIRCDSRLVNAGDMFVAIVGEKTDGHEYIEAAIQKGATVVAVQKGHFDISIIPDSITVIVADETRKLLALSACNYYDNPSREFKLVGVTGTKGKTTTTYMIKSILEKAGKKVGLIGTIANYLGDRVLESQRTTPESIDLQKMFREMADNKVDVVVMEVSSHALALDRVYGCTFDIAIFTNLTQDHLDFHGTFDNYLAAKAKLFQMAKEGYVNCDDMHARKLMTMATCPVNTYGIDNNPFVCARDIIITNSYSDFKLPFNRVIERIKVGIPGRFTVYNALAAICATVRLGCTFENISEGLAEVKVPGRSEIVPTVRSFTIMVDYAHSPDSLENILRASKLYTKGKIICVFGCGGDRDKMKRPMMGEIAGRLAGFTVITSDNPRTEKPEEIVKQIEDGMKKTNGKYKVIVDRRKAIEYALKMAERNDLVLVAGKGHETYQEINGEKHHFDDREVIKEALKKLPESKDRNMYAW